MSSFIAHHLAGTDPSLSGAKRFAQFLSSSHILCYVTFYATQVLDIKSQLILLSLIPIESQGPTPLALFTRHCVAGNGIHIMLHYVALTSTVVITVEKRLQSA